MTIQLFDLSNNGTRRLSMFRTVDETGTPDGRFGCAASNLAAARRYAAHARHKDAPLINAGPLPFESSPRHCIAEIENSPLLGPDWLPLASVIARAAEGSRTNPFWRMDTYAPQAGFHPDGSPFVQGLTEFNGTHVLEVGGLGHGDGWTSRETRDAFTLLGWSEIGDEVSNNLSFTLADSWTGERIAQLVLEIFVSVYGHDIEYPIAFSASLEARLLAAMKLDVFEGGEIYVSPAGRARWAKHLKSAPARDISEAESSTEPEHEPEPKLGLEPEPPEETHFREQLAVVLAKHRIAHQDEIAAELQRHRRNEPPTWGEGAPCPDTMHEARPNALKWQDVFGELADHLPTATLAVAALSELTSRLSHTGNYLDRFTALIASNPLTTLEGHANCGSTCVLASPAGRVLFARCTDDLRGLAALRYDRCEIVRSIAIERVGPATTDSKAERLGVFPPERSGCGANCLDAYGDCNDALRYEGLSPISVPVHMRRHLRKFDTFFWATHDHPLPSSDYFLDFGDVCDVTPVPDQFAVTHAGYGANSYSLNLRITAGPVAFVAQIGWGGAYGGDDHGPENWEEIVATANELLQIHATTWSPERFRTRPWFVSYSDFRHDRSAPWLLRWVGEGNPPDDVGARRAFESPMDLIAQIERLVE